jgi:hypothetical protein
MEEIADIFGSPFDVGLIHNTRLAFADHVEATFKAYRKGDPVQADEEGLASAHKALTKGLKYGVDADQLREVQLELAKGDLTNSTHVMAKGRAILLWAAYERRAALIKEKEALGQKIEMSGWPELWSRFRRWRIDRLLRQETGSDDLAEKKKLLGSHWNVFHELRFKEEAPPTSYTEKLQIVDEFLASGENIALESRALTIKRLLGQVIAIEKKLGAAPTLEHLREIGKEIVADLRASPRLLDVQTAKQVQKQYNEQLAWGLEGIAHGLESPANWTGIRRVAVKEAYDGKIYASSTVALPLFEKMVPVVSFAKDKALPANGWIETHKVIGVKESRTVGYRIAALRTEEAAQKAFNKINLGANDYLHLSSLLTPAWFITPDSALLRTEVKHVRNHAGKLIHTNVPVNRLGWVGRWPSDVINQKAFEEYDELVNDETRPLLTEIKELWNSGKTSNQFEVPAKLSLLNQQLGIKELWHCMSTKDRSSEKDGAAHFYIDQHYTGGAGEDSLAERHRQAVNRRQSALIALSNPQRNTGFAGTKMKLWKPLVDYRAGFDAEYVLEKMKETENKGHCFRELTGADELGERRAKALEAEVNRIGNDRSALRELLRQVAFEKAQTFKPMSRVKA